MPRRKRTPFEDETRRQFKLIFFEILEYFLQELSTRFQSLVAPRLVELLDPEKAAMHQNDFPRAAFSSLLASHGRHFEYAKLETELRAFYHSNELTCLFPHELLDMLLSTRRFKAMPQVTKLCELVLTVPATTASAERSFSVLKRIKTASRNTMGQGRLSSLSLFFH